MPGNSVYSIQYDPPWIHKPARGSFAPTASVYSEDYEGPVLDHPDMPQIPPLRVRKTHHPSYHAHPEQQTNDNGPQVRQSRLPIFKQVRSMLHKPASSNTKNEQISGTPNAHGKTSSSKSPYEGAFEARRGSPTRLQKKQPKSVRSLSPVSILAEEEIERSSPQFDRNDRRDQSPVSPVSPVFDDRHFGPSQMSVNTRLPLPETPPNNPSIKPIKRKPAPSTLSENTPPHRSPPSRESDLSGIQEATHPKNSHFSWTTYAPSVAPTRPSIDTNTPRHSKQPSGEVLPPSRFSWSTVGTAMTNQIRPDSPPPSPPPPVPFKYRTPPVQSILSRHRPVQRMEQFQQQQWTPPPRKTSLPDSTTGTPTSAKSKLTINSRPFAESNNGSAKKLPLPPELLTPVSPMSHLETLLTEEQDKIHQRKNIERAIMELTKLENASPMDVSFAQLKDAKKRLGDLRTTLSEVQLEEREIGIAIARARRKEGEEEGLWVRRVTG